MPDVVLFVFGDSLNRGEKNNQPITKAKPDKKACFFKRIHQYTTKIMLMINNIGTAKLNTEKMGTDLGDTNDKK